MSHRLGVCSSCDAKYKIPSSFTANQAKCKACGGVVNISDPEGAKPAAPPVPARKVAPAPKPAARKPDAKRPAAKKPELEEVKGSGKKRSGPSMKERLLAEREAAAKAQAAAPKKPAAAAKPARRAQVAKKAAAEETGDRPKRERTRAGAARGSKRGAAATTTRRSGARGSKRRGEADAEIGENEETAPRGRRGAKKKSPMVPLVSVALLLLASVGGFLYMQDDDVAAADDATMQETDMAMGEADAMASESEKDMSELEATEAAPEMDAEPEAAVEKPKPKKPKKPADPASIDLSEIEDFGPVDGMSEDDFQVLTEKGDLMVDPEAGAAGNRAKLALIEAGRLAFPVFMNKFKTLDFSTEQGRQDGDVIQKALEEICNGKNFGWRYSTEPADVLFNKKVVRNWATNWRKAQDDPSHWDKMSGKAKKAKEAAKEASEFSEDSMDDLDDF